MQIVFIDQESHKFVENITAVSDFGALLLASFHLRPHLEDVCR